MACETYFELKMFRRWNRGFRSYGGKYGKRERVDYNQNAWLEFVTRYNAVAPYRHRKKSYHAYSNFYRNHVYGME